jgi:threonine dehydrogenase-like Zn-dependent dehydrogenase
MVRGQPRWWRRSISSGVSLTTCRIDWQPSPNRWPALSAPSSARVCTQPASGAQTVLVSEPSPYRRALAQRLGADVVIDPRAADPIEVVRDMTDGLGADVVFESVGLPATIEQAIALAAPGGTVAIVGVTDLDARATFAPQELFFKELTIVGSRESTHAADRSLRWLGKLDLAPLITHTFPLSDVQSALDLALSGQAGKVLLEP